MPAPRVAAKAIDIGGTPLRLALRGWGLSLLLGLAAAALLYGTSLARAPLVLTLALCTTALGTLLPMLRDVGQLDSGFGRMFLAAGTVGEVAPIVAMSLLLSQEFSTWQQLDLLLLFLLMVALAAAAGWGFRPPRLVALLGLTLHASTQLPVRLALLYGGHLPRGERLPLALYLSVASLSLVVVITDIGVRTNSIGSRLAAAVVGAAVLSVLIFPTLGAALMARSAAGGKVPPTSPG